MLALLNFMVGQVQLVRELTHHQHAPYLSPHHVFAFSTARRVRALSSS